MSFDAELRSCIALVLGADVPPAEGAAVGFYGQWLAERNLGLVPVAEPAGFSWPGNWIARVRAGGDDHAVVMFGSPSGPLHDDAGALAAGGSIEQGWVIARLDLHLPIDGPAGGSLTGSVAGILVAPDAEAPMLRVGEAAAIAGRCLEGDRYVDGRGTFSKPGRGYQLTLVQDEVLEDVGVSWEQARRNVVTRGIDLNQLVGRRFTIGRVECIGRRLAEPCSHLERLSGPGILRPLIHRGGLRADILHGGTISVGDTVASAD
jgi:MOSC domain